MWRPLDPFLPTGDLSDLLELERALYTAPGATGIGVSRWRFQLDNHLGSASLELDQAGNVISYEEYHPYGSTAFSAASGAVQVSAKRYRYTGKERDEETGLYLRFRATE